MITGWIVTHPLTTGLVAVILFLSAGLGIQSYRLNSVRAEVAEAHAALTKEQAAVLVCKANTSTLTTAIESRNQAVVTESVTAQSIDKERTERAIKAISAPLPVASGHGAKAMNLWLESVK